MTRESMKAVEVFYSYAHRDEKLCNALVEHLSTLRRQGYISEWHDRQLVAGSDWAQEIDAHLRSASLILLLISPSFIASDYCYGIEMELALERHQAGQARVIPIILRPTDLRDTPFTALQFLPAHGKAITTWQNRDEAFLDVARGIRTAIENLPSSAASMQPPVHSQAQPRWNVPYPRNPLFTGREHVLERLATMLNTGKTVAVTQPLAISGLGGIVRHEAARVIVSCNNEVRTKPAVPPAVSLNGEAGRQQPVRSPLTMTLNRKVGSQTVRGDCYLLASKRIRG